VSGNNAAGDGGGIFNDNVSTLTLTNSTVSGNTAGDDAGGIINDHGSTATLTNSTVSGNDAGDDGGGIRNFGTTNLFSSTIANNRAGLNSSPTNFGGGGVHNFGGTLTLTNSTVSGNVARTHGGGIFVETGTVASFSSTIANNRADAESNGSGIGGGVYNWSELGATFNFQNTIIANNQVGSNPNNIRDCAGTHPQGYTDSAYASGVYIAPARSQYSLLIPFSESAANAAAGRRMPAHRQSGHRRREFPRLPR
jgi:predicted outer membrane repeat protein